MSKLINSQPNFFKKNLCYFILLEFLLISLFSLLLPFSIFLPRLNFLSVLILTIKKLMSSCPDTLSPQKHMVNAVRYLNDNDKQKMVMNKGMENGRNDANETEKKDDRCGLREWKDHQHLEKINVSSKPDNKVDSRPGVEIVAIAIKCPGRPDIVLSEPFTSTPKACLFTLKEGSRYRLGFRFIVSNKPVSGLKYVNTLWKAGVRVDKSIILLGSFNPNQQPYSYELGEDTAPSGIFVRGLYCARTKVVDDHDNCYLDIKYYFEIQKTWPISTT